MLDGRSVPGQSPAQSGIEPPSTSSRARGLGRKSLTTVDVALIQALDTLIEPLARGDLQSPLRRTCTRTANLAAELTAHHCAIKCAGRVNELFLRAYSATA